MGTPNPIADVLFPCDAVLFDLDGTLIDSLPAVDRAWRNWALANDLDPGQVLPHIHGRRSLDSIRALAPHLDAEAQNAILRRMESTDTEGVTILPGAHALLAALPEHTWTIVTSGTSDVAQARLKATGIPIPPVAVYGEDVANGKPAPDPYLLGAAKLGVEAARCVVFEDTVAGIRSAHAAGMRAIGIASNLEPAQLAEADAVVADLGRVRVVRGEFPGRFTLAIDSIPLP